MTNQLPPGRILNNNCYRIIEFIGQGGFGITYLAEELGYYRKDGFGVQYVANKVPEKVVVKELYFADFCQRNDASGTVNITSGVNKDQFDKLVNKQLEEGKILKGLNNDHIVKTRDIFKENDTAYMVMDFVDGINMADLIQKGGRLDRDKAIGYVRQILLAVVYIHEKKILHLDITPSNILVETQTDRAVLIDFGASLTYGENDHVSANTSKLVAGRAKYYTPVEQMELDNLMDFDATFDTYAIGATLYHMLTGTPPPVATLLVSGRQKLMPPSAISQTAGITDYLDNIIIRALNIRYDKRYKSAAEMDNDLGNEVKYRYRLNMINKLLAEGNFQEALKETQNGIALFGITQSLTELLERCNAGITNSGGDNENKWKYYWQYRTQGDGLYNTGAWDKAIEIYRSALNWMPKDDYLLQQIAASEHKMQANNSQNNIREKITALELKLVLFQKEAIPADKAKDNGYLFGRKQRLDEIGNGLAAIRQIKGYTPNDERVLVPILLTYEKEGKDLDEKIKALNKPSILPAANKKLFIIGGVAAVVILIGIAIFVYHGRGRKYYLAALSTKDSAVWLSNMLQSAQCKYDSAYNKLGDYYLLQTKRKDSSAIWYDKAAEDGNTTGEVNLANAYDNGQGVKQDSVKALYWMQIAADKGDADAENYIGFYNASGNHGFKKNDTAAFNWYKKAADQGAESAEYNLGNIYRSGRAGLKADNKKAVYWYTLSGKQGDQDAEYILGYMYIWGDSDVRKTDTTGVGWLRKAAVQGHDRAEYWLGAVYKDGVNGVPENDDLAFHWFALSAAQGNDMAENQVGEMYYYGKAGLSEDREEAYNWYIKAADQGNADAQYSIGYMYENGLGGLTADPYMAKAYYKRSCDNGYQTGCDNYDRLNK